MRMYAKGVPNVAISSPTRCSLCTFTRAHAGLPFAAGSFPFSVLQSGLFFNMPKRARTELTPLVKKDIRLYKQRHPKASQEVTAADVGRTHSITIGRSTVSDVLKEKQKWLALDLTGSTKRHWPAKHAKFEEALFLWQSKLAARRVPLSDKLLQSKAKEFGARLSIADFAYSRGWLQNFKKRYGIKDRSDPWRGWRSQC